MLWRALGGRVPGFYVDVGAYDPTVDSVTRALYERGWRGINVEPQPERLAAFLRDRPEDVNLAIAIGDIDGTAALIVPRIPGWASLAPGPAVREAGPATSVEVPVRRLDSLLAELDVTKVDVLKVDVEGAEPAVVRGMLSGPVRPAVCVVEGVAPGPSREAGDEAVALLVAAGYLHCMFDGLNHYLTTDPRLVEALSVPANPLDDYVPAAVTVLESERAELLSAVARLTEENAKLRAAAAQDGGEQRDGASPAQRPGTIPTGGDAAVLPAVEAIVDPMLREQRRRTTFARMLRGAPRDEVADASARNVGLLRLAFAELSPDALVAELYREILGRDVDPDGKATWVAAMAQGWSATEIAAALASSPEGLHTPPARRSRVSQQLQLWSGVLVLTEFGLVDWQVSTTERVPGRARREVFARALFDAGLGRPPSQAELDREVHRLESGLDRQRVLTDFVRRPEAAALLLGRPAGRVRRRLLRRRLVVRLRPMVEAAEVRQVETLVQNITPFHDVIERAREDALRDRVE